MNMHTPKFLDTARWGGMAYISEWQEALGGTINVTDPANGNVLAAVGFCGEADVQRAASQARAAQKAWAKVLPATRAAILNRAADLLEQNGAELASWIMQETGSIHAKAMIEIEHGALFLRHAASLAVQPSGMFLPGMDDRTHYARRVPHGVVGVISPFNFPLVLSIRSIAAAIVLGNARGAQARPAHTHLRRDHHRPHIRRSGAAEGRSAYTARRC